MEEARKLKKLTNIDLPSGEKVGVVLGSEDEGRACVSVSVPLFLGTGPCLDRAMRADLISFKEADRMAWSFVVFMSVSCLDQPMRAVCMSSKMADLYLSLFA